MKKIDKILKLYQFKNELGEVIDWTEGQKYKIMSPIVELGAGGKQMVQIETPTRYGKSAAVAAAILMRCTEEEQWALVAGTADKAQIIMDYFIDYALENPISRELLKNQVEIDKLKQERSRRRLTFSSGFSIRVFSADSRNKQATGNAIMGFGSPFVVLDEAALVDDNIESKIFRMIAGFSTTRHLYIKIGNPFYRNHFWKSHNDPDFHQIWVDYKQGINEGRYTDTYIEKARKKPNFDVLYEVKFPGPGAVDDKGWSPLLTEEDIEAVFVDNGSGFGFLKVGVDPAGEGTNFNSVIARYRNYAKIVLKKRAIDQFKLTEWLTEWKKALMRNEDILPMGYWVDRVGIGEGYYQTMNKDLQNVHGVNVGQSPMFDKDNFVNMRAEAYWNVREDIKSKKLHLEKDEDWLQLANIRYRTKLEGKKGKIEIMSKDEMRKNGVDSPDIADGLALTYVMPDPFGSTLHLETQPEEVASTDFDKYAPFNEM